jgi:hypothetical protein
MYVGHGPGGPADTLAHDHGMFAIVVTRLCLCIGRDAAPVWCNPRWRSEAARNPRAESEAGTRRTHGRWEPTHGEQHDQPSSLPGSGSADARRTRGRRTCKKVGSQLLTLEVIATLGIRRGRQPERRRSGGCFPSPACPCWASTGTGERLGALAFPPPPTPIRSTTPRRGTQPPWHPLGGRTGMRTALRVSCESTPCPPSG